MTEYSKEELAKKWIEGWRKKIMEATDQEYHADFEQLDKVIKAIYEEGYQDAKDEGEPDPEGRRIPWEDLS